MELDNKTTGVLVVDVQGDFTEYKKGSLAVLDTSKAYLEKVEDALLRFREKGVALFATQDLHPEDHISFYTSHTGKAALDTIEVEGRIQVLWPPHCISNTQNAQVLPDNRLFESIVQKGCDPKFDSYSGFFDDGGADTGLDRVLKDKNISTLLLFGLATDYCVKFTALDAVKSGFQVIVITDLCRGVAPDTTRSAKEEMEKAGIQMLTLSDVLRPLQAGSILS
jgi:nicotinamidase/pyrazinamidase